MKLQYYFIAWIVCSIVGAVAKIMHLHPLVSKVFLLATIVLSAVVLLKFFNRLSGNEESH